MSQHGTFYVITANPGVRPNRLKKFLFKEWFPALEGTSGCLDVEIWESQRSSGRYLVCELWESREIYLQNTEKLWNEEKKDVFQSVNSHLRSASLKRVSQVEMRLLGSQCLRPDALIDNRDLPIFGSVPMRSYRFRSKYQIQWGVRGV